MPTKDPAFLLYTGDVYKDTSLMSDEELGKYFRIMLAQHHFSYITPQQYSKITGEDYSPVSTLGSVLEQTPEGMLFIPWLDEAIERRNRYSKSRSNNGRGSKPEDMEY
jgi:hypothetical protein